MLYYINKKMSVHVLNEQTDISIHVFGIGKWKIIEIH